MSSRCFLGIEGGGTRTVAIVADTSDRLIQRIETGPANLCLLTDAQLSAHLRYIKRQLPGAAAIGIALAGTRTEADRQRLLRIARCCWPMTPVAVSHDLDSALAAVGVSLEPPLAAEIIILSGTGSCVYGRNPRGEFAKVGGWGHLLGDRGSGYELAHRALREAVILPYDRTGAWGFLGARILRRLLLNEPEDLIGWIHAAPKSEIAALAPEVFAAAHEGDRPARSVIRDCAAVLAADAARCAVQLAKPSQPVRFAFVGGVLKSEGAYRRQVQQAIRRHRPGVRDDFVTVERETAWGAVAMAHHAWKTASQTTAEREKAQTNLKPRPPLSPIFIPERRSLPPTERRHPRSNHLDRLPLSSSVALLLDEESRSVAGIATVSRSIEHAIRLAVSALRRGGRLIYVGAGTSGRLGVLDASECPPTFSTPPEWVQGIMAGGVSALWSSIEGAEDDVEAGARAVKFRRVGCNDLVVGIAASGRTSFVWGALGAAQRCGARTGLICSNPLLRFPRAHRPDVVIALPSGPEVLTGSTRMKAGTATKIVLNTLTTLTMVRLGKVISNLMVDLNASNEKLRDRAIRMVVELTGAHTDEARAVLVANRWQVATAVKRLGFSG